MRRVREFGNLPPFPRLPFPQNRDSFLPCTADPGLSSLGRPLAFRCGSTARSRPSPRRPRRTCRTWTTSASRASLGFPSLSPFPCKKNFIVIVGKLPGGAATCFEGFVNFFFESSQAVGLYCSCHAAQASKGNFQKTCYKTFGTSGRPTQYRAAT